MKHAIVSSLAAADVQSALEFYVTESARLATSFIAELERATHHIELHPATGIPRYSHELNIPQLRHWPLKKFPFALFYIEHADHLDVIRFVHTSRDVPASLQDE